MTDEPDHFRRAIELIDAANAEDPNTEIVDGEERPACLVYGERMTAHVERYAPEASEALRLAARAQHIRRWEIPRDDYPRTRRGYHQWRRELYGFHADRAEEILREVGYHDGTVERVRDLLTKRNLGSDPEMQTLEDVICLVFLEHYFDDFQQDHGDEKLVRILRRTWKKMSDRGHRAAEELELSERAGALLRKALDEEGDK